MTVLGLMSGTSLDGLDLALCSFEPTESGYSYQILASTTVAFTPDWKDRLNNVKNATALEYFGLNSLFGKYIANEVNAFVNENSPKPNAIASHGHTVFHQPASGFSTQLGCGATIAAHTGITTVCDFRSLDVANGGQGAPLVPIGDKLLFGAYDACLNIGGIANLSFDDKNGNRLAYDICEANMLLNFLAETTGKAYDKNGDLARVGNLNAALLTNLNQQDYYTQSGAKSIGREWFEKNILPLVASQSIGVNDLLATATEHVAQIIAVELTTKNIKNVLVTGGGTFNTFLIEKIKSKTNCELIIPENRIVDFKEALIFAFLGYLRLQQKTNALKSVTGAAQNSCGGAVYLA
ncbi:MAG: anhydro-N-acetylmuramic acid kinase [Bacteroidota bacterium]